MCQSTKFLIQLLVVLIFSYPNVVNPCLLLVLFGDSINGIMFANLLFAISILILIMDFLADLQESS